MAVMIRRLVLTDPCLSQGVQHTHQVREKVNIDQMGKSGLIGHSMMSSVHTSYMVQ